jgi:hypothetical protein
MRFVCVTELNASLIDPQYVPPLADETRERMYAFYRHFGMAEYEQAKKDGYIGCKPHEE